MRHALRRLVSRPARLLVVVTTLAVGLASSAAIGTVVAQVLLRPFPFAEQERLVTVWSSDRAREIEKLEITFDELEMLRRDARALVDIAAVSAANFSAVLRKADGTPFEMKANLVSSSFFDLLGIEPAAGRAFTAAENEVGAPPAAMIAHGLWTREFGADPSVIGSWLAADDETSIEIVGVLPPNLDLPDDAEVVFPLGPQFADEGARTNSVLMGLARLAPGIDLATANRELEVLSARMAAEYPESHEGIAYAARPLVGEILGATGPTLRILFAMAALLLAITLFNAANVLLIEGIARQREFAIRASLGASWKRLFGELLTQIALELALAAALAVALAAALVSLILRVAPRDLPRLAEIGFDRSGAAIIVVVAAVAAVGFAGLVTLRARRTAAADALRSGSHQSTSPRATRRLLDVLVVLQLTIALVSLVTAAVMVRSFRNLDRIGVGFDRAGVVTAHLPLGYTLSPEPEVKRQLFRDLLARIEAVPGVVRAGSVLMRPLEMELGWDFRFTIEGQGMAEQERNPMANLLAVTPGYHEAMGIALRAGRTFDGTEQPDGTKVVLVSESFAARLGGTGRAVGKRIKHGPIDSEAPWLQVAGVVSDVRYRSLTTGKLDIYVPFTQTNWSPNYLAIRTNVDPESVVPAVRKIVADMIPDVPLASVATTGELVAGKLAQPKLNAVIVALFASAAVFLSLVGLYGVLDSSVRQRTAELGLRVALGAGTRALVRMVLRDALEIAVAGVGMGLALSIVLGRSVRALLYEVDPLSPGMLVPASIALVLAAIFIALRPALRAARVDPIVALRSE